MALKLWDKKDVILKNKPEKLLKTKANVPKTKRNKPENKAEKLLKTRSCGKNKPETNRKTKLPISLKTNRLQNPVIASRGGPERGNVTPLARNRETRHWPFTTLARF
ncbi:MAG TPA: hypothetical protein VFQ24_04210 [Terriglobia bacterium]|nr:hypothetical protein [Terriglobia bacterium]